MLKTRNLNTQFAYAVSRNEMTEDTRHSGGFSGASIRTRVSGDHISNTQASVCFYFSSRAKPRLAALGRGQLRSLVGHGTTNRVSIQGAGASMSRSLTADVNVRPDNDSPGIAE